MDIPPNETKANEGTRTEVTKKAETLLASLSGKFEEEQREKVLDLIKNDASNESLQRIDKLLSEAQKVFANNSIVAIAILKAMVSKGADGHISEDDVLTALGTPQGPEIMQKIGGMIEKTKVFMDGLTAQLGILGSEMMQMLENFLGKNPLFQQIFSFLKNTPAAQKVCLEKKLQAKGLSLKPDINMSDLAVKLTAQAEKCIKVERKAVPADTKVTYNIVSHIAALIDNIPSGITDLDAADIESAGKETVIQFEKNNPPIPVQTPPATVPPSVPPATPPAQTAAPAPAPQNA